MYSREQRLEGARDLYRKGFVYPEVHKCFSTTISGRYRVTFNCLVHVGDKYFIVKDDQIGEIPGIYKKCKGRFEDLVEMYQENFIFQEESRDHWFTEAELQAE